jgi:hypothetical protein
MKPIPKITTVYLEFYEGYGLHIYYCNSCRNPVMQYNGETMEEIPGFKRFTCMMIVQCKNPHCRRRYNFVGFAYPL